MPTYIKRILLLVNLSANAGRAKTKWHYIKSEIINKLPDDTIIIAYHPPFDLLKCLRDAIEENQVNCIISAGGDGSLNILLNTLIRLKGEDLSEFYIGAIGLGSSNDYHKPYKHKIKNIPIKINTQRFTVSDIGSVQFQGPEYNEQNIYFLINSSIGITAEANLFFNSASRIIKFLKKVSVQLAILYTSFRTIARFKPFLATLKFNSFDNEILMSNLAILKNPHVSGKFAYDQIVFPGDGRFGINVLLATSKIKIISALVDLSRGEFSGRAQRISVFTSEITVETNDYVALEMDGEVYRAKHMNFSICPKSINLLDS